MAAKLEKEKLDLSVFETIGTECFGNDGDVDVKGCDHIVRLVIALQYYEVLQRTDDMERKKFFIEFISTVYTESQVINDWIHFMQTHSNQIEDIHDQLTSSESAFGGGCSKGAEFCTLFNRHYNGDRWSKHKVDENEEQDEGTRIVFLGDLFDRIHHFLYHLFDSAMRTKRETVNELTGAEEKSNDEFSNDGDSGFLDKVFAAKRQALSARREKLKAVTERCDDTKHNKFNITTVQTEIGQKRKPFLQALCEHLFPKHWTDGLLGVLRSFIAAQQYDSDAVAEDVCDGVHSSNLVELLRGNGDDDLSGDDNIGGEAIKIFVDYIKEMKLSPVAFSTGLTWFYWEAYRENIPNVTGAFVNPNDYGGHSAKELFVEKRYANYKEEILHHISMEDYQKLVIYKVKQYMKSDAVKKLKVHTLYTLFFHYGLKADDPINDHHICSIVLYCDFTEFCRKFSATFRKLERWETIQSAKCRNQEYYWQSRYFRETVEMFGTNGRAGETGPFYCGIDCIMVIPSFCLRLIGPTSTSKQLEVAINFAKETGIILQMNNDGHTLAQILPFFDCSWLSNFADEDERVFCGGHFTIRLQSIRIVAMNKNYQSVNHALFVLDCMLSGAIMSKGNEKDMKLMKLKKREVTLLKTLLLQTSSLSAMDEYVIDTFQAYIRSKRQIKVVWGTFDYNGIDDTVCELVAQAKIEKMSITEKPSEDVNMIAGHIFKVLKFTEEYVINTSYQGYSYKFDLREFVSVICDGSWTRIVIEDIEKRWISHFWDSEERQEICYLYGQKGFGIEFSRGVWNLNRGIDDLKSESLIIVRN